MQHNTPSLRRMHLWMQDLKAKRPAAYAQLTQLFMDLEDGSEQDIFFDRISEALESHSELRGLVLEAKQDYEWGLKLGQLVEFVGTKDKALSLEIREIGESMGRSMPFWASLNLREKIQIMKVILCNLKIKNRDIVRYLKREFQVEQEKPLHSVTRQRHEAEIEEVQPKRAKVKRQRNSISVREHGISVREPQLVQSSAPNQNQAYLRSNFGGALLPADSEFVIKMLALYFEMLITESEFMECIKGIPNLNYALMQEIVLETQRHRKNMLVKPSEFYQMFLKNDPKHLVTPSYMPMYPYYPTSKFNNNRLGSENLINYKLVICIDDGSNHTPSNRIRLVQEEEDSLSTYMTKKLILKKISDRLSTIIKCLIDKSFLPTRPVQRCVAEIEALVKQQTGLSRTPNKELKGLADSLSSKIKNTAGDKMGELASELKQYEGLLRSMMNKLTMPKFTLRSKLVQEYLNKRSNSSLNRIEDFITETLDRRVKHLLGLDPEQGLDSEIIKPMRLLQELKVEKLPSSDSQIDDEQLAPKLSKLDPFLCFQFADKNLFKDVWMCMVLYLPMNDETRKITNDRVEAHQLYRMKRNLNYDTKVVKKLSTFFQLKPPNVSAISKKLKERLKPKDYLNPKAVESILIDTDLEVPDSDKNKPANPEPMLECPSFGTKCPSFTPAKEKDEYVLYCQHDCERFNFHSFIYHLRLLYELGQLILQRGIISAKRLKFLLLGLTWGKITADLDSTHSYSISLFKMIADFMGSINHSSDAYLLDLFASFLATGFYSKRAGDNIHNSILQNSLLRMETQDESQHYQALEKHMEQRLDERKYPLIFLASENPVVLRNIFKKQTNTLHVNFVLQRQFEDTKAPDREEAVIRQNKGVIRQNKAVIRQNEGGDERGGGVDKAK